MKNRKLLVVSILLASSQMTFANGADEVLLERNRLIEEMKHQNEKLQLQASMSESYKTMAEAGFIVDENGLPVGIGDMELLALQVRLQDGKSNESQFNPNDPFGGVSPIIPMPNRAAFGGQNGREAEPTEPKEEEGVEVVSKPTDKEKAEGKKVLALAEIRNNSALVFTNNGFEEVKVGGKVYDYKLASIGVDSIVLSGEEGNRVLRIDWTKSVRYSDD